VTVKVKVCGITNREDAAAALECGADALGFNFYRQSPRYIDPADACGIIRRLPPLAAAVGVFVNVPDPADIAAIALASGVRILQLHGDETPAYCRELAGWAVIKALRIGSGPLPTNLDEYPVRAFLLDAKDDVLFGGTGKVLDWPLAKTVSRVRPVILAGGLSVSNVGQAIRLVRPYAVDVCSGVESSPGKKDATRLKAFMDEVRNVATEIERPTGAAG